MLRRFDIKTLRQCAAFQEQQETSAWRTHPSLLTADFARIVLRCALRAVAGRGCRMLFLIKFRLLVLITYIGAIAKYTRPPWEGLYLLFLRLTGRERDNVEGIPIRPFTRECLFYSR